MKKVKMGIVGAGTWGETHAYIYNDHPVAEVAAICDMNSERAAALAAKFNIPASGIFTDHREMLERADIDAVAIVTPDFAHTRIAVDCANAGKHFIIEKPLTTTREEALEIVEAVERNGVRMMVDLHSRWSPLFAIPKQSIVDGEIGEPYSAYYRLNDIKWVATDLLPWAAKSSILWFLGYHSVDVLRWLFNDEVERVYAVSREGVLKQEGVDTVDIYQTILEFRGGGIVTMENGWITPNTNPNVNDMKLNITGTKGMFNIDPTHSQMLERFTETKADRPDMLVRHFIHGKPKGFAYESIRHFIDQLITDEPFFVTMEDAFNTTMVILAIMESAKTRTPVNVQYM
ncbi:Gfo/Idh/MocA family protein [Paenibacillus sp. 1011MAR3C5]|uniref:Gfo/Idh/MocA family protein n=1 Tax=Paenibacillus sp. 1011MAR3C5 TaxID=1675787 RepID=UPI001C72284F|nr:Gfo/Idh/MocA family oxidoreductase [Paenibacillus sp. 1011MAR3C5]